MRYLTDWDERQAAHTATPGELSQKQAVSPLPRPVLKETSICSAQLSMNLPLRRLLTEGGHSVLGHSSEQGTAFHPQMEGIALLRHGHPVPR